MTRKQSDGGKKSPVETDSLSLENLQAAPPSPADAHTSSETAEAAEARLQTAHEELDTAQRQANVRKRQQAVVAKLGNSALARKDLKSLLEEAVEGLADTLGVELAKVLQLQPDGCSCRLVAGVGWNPGLVGSAAVGCGETSQAGYTLRQREPVLVEDLRKERRFQGPELLLEHGVVSGMSVVIGSSERPWGVLGVHTRQRRDFNEHDVHFLQAVAHVLGEALQRDFSEQQLRDRETRLQLVTDALPVLIAYCDRDLVYRLCNARYTEWFGLRREDILGKTLLEVIGEQAYQRVKPYVDRVLSGERVVFENVLPYQHGPPRRVRVDYVPHFSPGDKVVGYYAMITDISDRLRAEETQARLAAIVEHSYDAIVGKEVDGTITTWNKAAEKMYGYAAEEVIGRPASILEPDDRRGEVQRIMRAVARGEPTEQWETVRKRKDGSLIEVLLTVSPIRSSHGEIVGASAIARDITQRKRAERELLDWAELLEKRVAERTAVAEKRAVDLRELATQITHAEQRARKRLARAIHDELQQILVAAKMRIPREGESTTVEELQRVDQLLSEALAHSRTLVTELSPPVLLDGSLDHAFEWLARHVEETHELRVNLHCEDDLSELEDNVKTVMFEVVRELLFNVVKHAETDRAELTVRRTRSQLEITVADEGKGFHREEVERSPGAFGLFNVRERIDAFGGRISLDSAPGQGTRLVLSVPLNPLEPSNDRSPDVAARETSPERQRSEDAADLEKKVTILVADDHKIVREGLVRILSTQPGLEVVGEAADGEEAVRRAVELRPDVVVMDITMPRLNGIEATRQIKERLPEIVVIGLSLHDEADLGAAIRRAGASNYLRKDAASTGLIGAIRSCCPPRFREPGEPAAGDAEPDSLAG